jgi:hypothetical protein
MLLFCPLDLWGVWLSVMLLYQRRLEIVSEKGKRIDETGKLELKGTDHKLSPFSSLI